MKRWHKVLLFNPLITLWLIALFMEMGDLAISNKVWYGFPLFLTNVVLIGISIGYMVYLFRKELKHV